ncbi:SCP2 sterol-binding domain-containing protein [Micromonospora narathiwatensis]|uniref:SCP-2 sterol transfer family protein n=1 Tax=Micromonospora narathiwatensis TaxID=299146 RepID=A0A1A8Z5M6_9ACTN|nr:SCP2 sterol-binding domain-containing protein [Micromonospora narathiwatensis]SBT39092.1 SCP-2 sterol transfer family protein [Micromonospora narathiwatensis]
MGASMAEQVIEQVAGRHPELPEHTAGTVRLDLHDGGRTEHWYLTIEHQNVEVGRSTADADMVVHADRAVFDRLASGNPRLVAALLRNDINVQGDMRLLLTLRRLFPGPSAARHPRHADQGTGGRSAPGTEAR